MSSCFRKKKPGSLIQICGFSLVKTSVILYLKFNKSTDLSKCCSVIAIHHMVLTVGKLCQFSSAILTNIINQSCVDIFGNYTMMSDEVGLFKWVQYPAVERIWEPFHTKVPKEKAYVGHMESLLTSLHYNATYLVTIPCQIGM